MHVYTDNTFQPVTIVLDNEEELGAVRVALREAYTAAPPVLYGWTSAFVYRLLEALKELK